MNNLYLLTTFAVLLIAAGAMVGYGLAIIGKPKSTEPTIDELAERAECNGIDLLRMARECTQLASSTPSRYEQARYQRWAGDLQRCACEHLQCINTIQYNAAVDAAVQAVSHG